MSQYDELKIGDIFHHTGSAEFWIVTAFPGPYIKLCMAVDPDSYYGDQQFTVSIDNVNIVELPIYSGGVSERLQKYVKNFIQYEIIYPNLT